MEKDGKTTDGIPTYELDYKRIERWIWSRNDLFEAIKE